MPAILAGGIVLLAAGVRIHDAGGCDLWADEANSVIMARQGPGELLARLKLDSNPPLYYLILHAWMGAFGASETAVRGLSIVGSVALVASVFLIGRRLFGTETAAIAALLLAVSPIQVFYSQQARMYTLLSVAALLSSYFLWRAIADGRPRFVVACGLSTLTALYLHNFALYLLPAHVVVLLWSGALQKNPRPWLLCGAAIALGYLPWLPVFLAQLGNKAQYSWYVPFWDFFGPGGAVLQTLNSFAPGGEQPLHVPFSGLTRAAWLPAMLFAGTAGLSLLPLARPAREEREQRARVGWLLSAVLVPLACALAVSSVLTPNYVPGRTDQLVFPGFVLLVGVGLVVVRPRILRYGLLACLLVLSLIGLQPVYARPRPNSDRAIARAIIRDSQPGDAVLTTSLTRATLEYYLGRSAAPVTLYSYPRDTARHLGNQDDEALLANPDRLQEELRLVAQEIRPPGAAPRRVFVVLAITPVNEQLCNELIAARPANVLANLGEFQQAGTGVPIVVVLLQL